MPGEEKGHWEEGRGGECVLEAEYAMSSLYWIESKVKLCSCSSSLVDIGKKIGDLIKGQSCLKTDMNSTYSISMSPTL